MRAVRLQQKGGTEHMRFESAPKPAPGAGEVLIQVHAAAVTPTELLWDLTWCTYTGEPREFPILSHEFSGVVSSLGDGVTGLIEGDEVYGLNDWTINGALAEYVIATPGQLAQKPSSISHQHAATVPLSALTAWQGLVVRADLKQGQRVLIHGAAGGVGNMATQLAHWLGAHVIATASTHNLDYVKQSGADEVIDYRRQRFEDVARNVDVIFDAVGGETLERSVAMLEPNTKLISIATESKDTEYFFYVEPNDKQLKEIACLIDAGELRSISEQVFPLAQARNAYETRARRGKLVVAVIPT